jgi:hypothetical protein
MGTNPDTVKQLKVKDAAVVSIGLAGKMKSCLHPSPMKTGARTDAAASGL